MISGRSGPWCQNGTRIYKGAPFDKALLRARAEKLSPVYIRFCKDADKEHADSQRQYAHTFCDDRHALSVVCVSRAYIDIPRDHRDGLLAHEIGHMLAGHGSSEAAADEAFRVLTGVKIRYKDAGYGSCLQYLEPKDSKKLEGLYFTYDLEFMAKLPKGKAANPEGEAFLPERSPEEQLPALAPAVLPPGVWAPPRVTFNLLATGKAPLIHLGEGRTSRPEVALALKGVMSRRGIADVNAWERLFLKAKAADAELFVVDRSGERWHVRDVLVDFGGETGRLVVLHFGPRSRTGDATVDIHRAFGYMIPVVVYRARRKGSDLPWRDIDAPLRDPTLGAPGLKGDYTSLYEKLDELRKKEEGK